MMFRAISVLLIGGTTLLVPNQARQRPPDRAEDFHENAYVEADFSPRGGVEAKIVRRIGEARESVRVQAYSFTSAPIAEALVDAAARGVDVEVILDDSQAGPRSKALALWLAKVPVAIDSKHAIAHNKIIIIDKKWTITGSYNFTKAAEESNAENCLGIQSGTIARQYLAHWDEHRRHSRPYAPAP